ncbi:MAG TPA: V-type ATPase 116kDa subunit family protein [Ornithinibacter sp.]|nr:V-type ATPase 116kDa subunit family protein [Ornithinibacter sp.]
MRWREAVSPVAMQRVALLAPRDELRELLVTVADEGTVGLDEVPPGSESRARGPATERLVRLHSGDAAPARLAPKPLDLARCEEAGRLDLIAGEAQVEQRSGQSLAHGGVVGLVGWMPAHDMPHLAERLSPVGGAVVPVPRPAGVQPPTLLPTSGASRELAPLVETYATVPYADVNPSLIAGLAYVVMFGMMFADVGHGALLLLAAVAVRLQWWSRLATLRPVWLFLAGAGIASMVFGALYGEFFGPTGVVPVLWLEPLENPVELLGAGVAVGALLLAGAYALGSVNRFREGGWRAAVYAPSGLAGAALFLGLGAVAAGVHLGTAWLAVLGGVVALAGTATAYAGLLASAGGGAAGAAEAGVGLFDLVLRLGSNLVSFARLAAFGLTHAALGAVIWQATVGLWPQGGLGAVGAVLVFLLGNAVAFALEGLVAGIQALRLEYYELFSRVFDTEGWPFRPWHVPLDTSEVPC